MDKYSRYYGIFAFVAITLLSGLLSYQILKPAIENMRNLNSDIERQSSVLNAKQNAKQTVERKLKQIKDSISNVQKKIYSPTDSDLGNDTLFFTLYNDLIEMIHSNSIKIKSIDYSYNPETDSFVTGGKDAYFVCEVNMELVSNYVNLGKLIQDIYQYPYYIKMDKISIKPYPKDKKILLTNMKLRLYAHTAPDENTGYNNDNEEDDDE